MMNIAYKGNFLREGLQENGHKLYDLNIKDGENLDMALKNLHVPIDLVLWEFYGAFSQLPHFSRCDTPVAAYCIDTPLNEFWLTPHLKNIDYVFVDQPQCVSSLARNGVEAEFLPLSAPRFWFQPECEKKFDIVFIGRTNSYRQKRTKLLKLLQSNFSINVMSGLSLPESQRIFSESRIVLNENLFPGLTMRILQGLSAGSIVYSEQSPFGDDFGLIANQDIILYKPDNVVERLSEILHHYDDYSWIGIQGQKKCEQLFSVTNVSAQLLCKINSADLIKKEIAEADWTWNRINSELLYVQRFGGSLNNSMKKLGSIASSTSDKAAEAHLLIGDIQARFKDIQQAREHYKTALLKDQESLAGMKLALLHIQANEPDKALKYIACWLKNVQFSNKKRVYEILGSADNMSQKLLSAISEIYFSLGKQLDMGFEKKFFDPVPDTAYDVAFMAWKLAPTPWALEMMLKCLSPHHAQGELLPYLLTGIKTGILSDVQILNTANIAYNYYDRETADMIITAMKKSK